MALFQNLKNGQVVEYIAHHDNEWAMVKNAGGAVSYVRLEDMVSYEAGVGRTGIKPEPQRAGDQVDEDVIPEAIIPPDLRVNVNVASPEELAKRVKGIGYSTAKKINDLRLSLPGERFRELEQLRKIGRVDWDEIFAEDVIYVG
jgi:DNA uptake protein ComE-like DNA-binding protein